MKSVVRDVSKVGSMVEVLVGFQTDAGEFHSEQRYAFPPESLEDVTIFDQQARAMQIEIDNKIEVAAEKERQALIDKPIEDKISELRQHFKLNLAEQIPLNESQNTR